jgi:hypothetical protein
MIRLSDKLALTSDGSLWHWCPACLALPDLPHWVGT